MIAKYITLAAALSLSLFSTAVAQQRGSSPPDSSRVEYHPFRKLGGKYCDLRQVYSWIESKRLNVDISAPQPMANWQVFQKHSSRYGDFVMWGGYQVVSVEESGILFHSYGSSTRRKGNAYGPQMFLKNFPGFKALTDNQEIAFIAFPCDNYRFKDSSGDSVSVQCFDYGVPYDPTALQAAEKAKRDTNSIASKP